MQPIFWQSALGRKRLPPQTRFLIFSSAMSISSPGSVVMVSLDRIPTEVSAQARVKIRSDVVRRYTAAMIGQQAEGGVRFSPVLLFTDGNDHWKPMPPANWRNGRLSQRNPPSHRQMERATIAPRGRTSLAQWPFLWRNAPSFGAMVAR